MSSERALARSFVLVLVLAIGLLSTSCRYLSPFRGPRERAKILAGLDERYPRSGIKQLVDDYQHENDPEKKKLLRNQILFQHMREIRNYHEAIETDLFETSAYAGFALDLGTLVATTLAAVVTPAGTKTFWAVVGAITGGTRLAASRNFLDEKDRSIVLAAMRKDQATQMSLMFDHMQRSVAEYPLEQGLLELMDFLNAGDVAGSVAELSKKVEDEKNDAEKRLDESMKSLGRDMKSAGEPQQGKEPEPPK